MVVLVIVEFGMVSFDAFEEELGGLGKQRVDG